MKNSLAPDCCINIPPVQFVVDERKKNPLVLINISYGVNYIAIQLIYEYNIVYIMSIMWR